jgi:hypothetical protein
MPKCIPVNTIKLPSGFLHIRMSAAEPLSFLAQFGKVGPPLLKHAKNAIRK